MWKYELGLLNVNIGNGLLCRDHMCFSLRSEVKIPYCDCAVVDRKHWQQIPNHPNLLPLQPKTFQCHYSEPEMGCYGLKLDYRFERNHWPQQKVLAHLTVFGSVHGTRYYLIVNQIWHAFEILYAIFWDTVWKGSQVFIYLIGKRTLFCSYKPYSDYVWSNVVVITIWNSNF